MAENVAAPAKGNISHATGATGVLLPGSVRNAPADNIRAQGA